MREVWELLREATPMQPDAVAAWGVYLQGFALHRKWPRYYMASADMAANPGKYRWLVVGGCLLVVKWVTMGGLKVHLALPPMSASGNTNAEREVLAWLTAAGVGARLSDEDLRLYGSGVEVTPCPHGPEFLYTPKDYTALTGDAWKKWRNALNHAVRVGWKVTRLEGSQVPPAQTLLREVSLAWGTERGKSGAHELRIAAHPQGVPNGWVNMVTAPSGAVQAWSAHQDMPNSPWAVAMVGHWVPSAFRHMNASVLLHLWDMQASSCQWVNMGSGVGDKRLVAAKRKLRPCHELQLFRTVTLRPVTREEWDTSRARPVGGGDALSLFGDG